MLITVILIILAYAMLISLPILLINYFSNHQFKEIFWIFNKPETKNPLDYSETYSSTKWKSTYKRYCHKCFSKKNNTVCDMCGDMNDDLLNYFDFERKIIYSDKIYYQYIVKRLTENFKSYVIGCGGTWLDKSKTFIINKKFTGKKK